MIFNDVLNNLLKKSITSEFYVIPCHMPYFPLGMGLQNLVWMLLKRAKRLDHCSDVKRLVYRKKYQCLRNFMFPLWLWYWNDPDLWPWNNVEIVLWTWDDFDLWPWDDLNPELTWTDLDIWPWNYIWPLALRWPQPWTDRDLELTLTFDLEITLTLTLRWCWPWPLTLKWSWPLTLKWPWPWTTSKDQGIRTRKRQFIICGSSSALSSHVHQLPLFLDLDRNIQDLL